MQKPFNGKKVIQNTEQYTLQNELKSGSFCCFGFKKSLSFGLVHTNKNGLHIRHLTHIHTHTKDFTIIFALQSTHAIDSICDEKSTLFACLRYGHISLIVQRK